MVREEHDQLYALDQLFEWARQSRRWHDGGRGLEGVVSGMLESGDRQRAVETIWAYIVVTDDSGDSLPLDLSRIVVSLTGPGPWAPESPYLGEVLTWLRGTPPSDSSASQFTPGNQ